MDTYIDREIRIAAALLMRDDGHTLLVRKRGTTAFMQPGGKIEPGEKVTEALLRELHEEIGLSVKPSDLKIFGRFEADAANEPGHIVVADVYEIQINNKAILASAEIEEAIWISPTDTRDVKLAPLTRDRILPLYRQTRLGLEF